LAFDVRSNMYANVLWVKQGGMLGGISIADHLYFLADD